MYTVGETERAIRLFLGLLRRSRPHTSSYDIVLSDHDDVYDGTDADKAFLEDFRLAFQVCPPSTHLLHDPDSISQASHDNIRQGSNPCGSATPLRLLIPEVRENPVKR